VRADVPYDHPEFSKAKACWRIVKQRANTFFGDAHIPAHFQACSFESYLVLSLASKQQQVAMRVLSFVVTRIGKTYAGEKRGRYLYGSWGMGKTRLAITVLHMAIETGQSGLYLPTDG
jgi:DNA replication protein DnaC